ncbi:substrate-binding domain-containing protein [Verrucomicrobiaceae bacterium N1E253]|uniref:Substrate-binding domain-containing protein n=1 Tax=Oceaniferula marina TaxID=2748318 RepID=A0A851GFS1_9BACT|nr:substrate-binding domain-containing protein [Oceaniferula marina]NWK54125.1 substrate-binding domain-containing protein [Oceaniferula marina]
MDSLPPRNNRALQAVDLLKNEILSGQLKGFLPGERELAKRIRVSRITLRKAMQILENQKWVSPTKAGCRRKTLKRPHSKNKKAGGGGQGESAHLELGKTIVVLAPVKLDQMPSKELFDHTRLNSYCSRVGITLLHRVADLSHLKRPGHRLREFIKQNPADLYLLQLATEQTQKWFYQHDVPSIVLGSTWEEANLPSADMHQQALGVHVAHLLTRMGHRRVGMLFPDPVKAGMQNFLMNLRQAAPEMDVVLANEDDSQESVTRALQKLVSDPERRPSAIILPRVAYASLATGFLPSLGLRIPEDISLICLVYDEVLAFLYPQVAGYRIPVDAYPKAIFDLAVKCLRHPEMRNVEHALIIPDFVPGGSLSKHPG